MNEYVLGGALLAVGTYLEMKANGQGRHSLPGGAMLGVGAYYVGSKLILLV
jgi:hypothetical protein